MSKQDLAVEPGADEKANKDLKPAAENVGTVATQVQSINDAQTEAKWGTEKGPQRFRTEYVKVLSTAQDEIAALKRELEAYVATINQVVAGFTKNDDDSATAQKILDGRSDHEANEAAGDPPPAPTPPKPAFGSNSLANSPFFGNPSGDAANKVCTAPAPPPALPTANSLTNPNS